MFVLFGRWLNLAIILFLNCHQFEVNSEFNSIIFYDYSIIRIRKNQLPISAVWYHLYHILYFKHACRSGKRYKLIQSSLFFSFTGSKFVKYHGSNNGVLLNGIYSYDSTVYIACHRFGITIILWCHNTARQSIPCSCLCLLASIYHQKLISDTIIKQNSVRFFTVSVFKGKSTQQNMQSMHAGSCFATNQLHKKTNNSASIEELLKSQPSVS